ncbi:MAG: hypothetical protein WBC44_08650 [Planctomycetaceae bacterium]
MFRPAVTSPISAPADGKSIVDTLVDELMAGGADLRCISLGEMKRRLAAALRTRRLHAGGSSRRASVV